MQCRATQCRGRVTHRYRPCAAAALLLLAGGAALADPSSNLYDGGASVAVTFVDKISDGHEPTVNLGFDGAGSFNSFTMDTGSVGILASRQYFTPPPDAKVLGPGIQTYTSDHKTEYGTWYEATQKIYDKDGKLVAEAAVPVMLVEKVVTCDASGTSCTTDNNPDTHMMGIGFAREGAAGQQDPQTHAPSYNAFLNLTAVARTPGGPLVALPADWHNGYVVQDDKIQLGLTSGNTASAGFIKLKPNPDYYTEASKEWSSVTAAITAGSQTSDGTVLMDSGLPSGLLNPSGGVSTFRCNDAGAADPHGKYHCAAPGTYFAVSLPTGTVSIFQYDFNLGASDPMAPSIVHVTDESTAASFNTSFHVFEGVELIFDADNGFVGYRAGAAGAPSINMSMALGGQFTIPDKFESSLPLALFAPSTLSPLGLATFTGVVSGSDRLIIDGPGRVVFGAANTYTGDTEVRGGTLSVNGSIQSNAFVYNGGVLGGTGQLANLEVRAGGIYAPGNSIGTQTIAGNLRFAPGGVFAVEVDPTSSDKAEVQGAIDLTGGVLQVIMALDKYGPVTTREIIDNQGGAPVTGEFAKIVNPLVFFKSSVAYDGGSSGDDVVLTLVRSSDYSAVAQTPNEYAVARALEGFSPDDPLIEALQLQTLDGALQAFNALSGEVHATIGSVLADQSRYVRQTLLGRLLQVGHGSGDGMVSAAAPTDVAATPAGMMALGAGGDDWGASPGPRMADLVFWTKAYGAWGALDANGNAATADRTLGGVLTGADTRLDEGWRIGFATGYAQSSISAGGGRNSSASVDTVNLAGYAGGMMGPVVVRAGGAWSWDSIDSSRSVVFPGFFEQEQASYGGDTGQVFGELALPGKWDQMLTEPFAGLAWVHVGTDGFAESGPLAGLKSNGFSDGVGYSTLGARVAGVARIGGVEVTPRASVAWQHAFGDVTPQMALAFASGGAPFVVGGTPLATDAALVEAGVGIALLEAGMLEVSYFGQLAPDAHDNAVEGRFRWTF